MRNFCAIITLFLVVIIVLSTSFEIISNSDSSLFSGTFMINNEICVGNAETGEGKPVATGYVDYKPTWSKDGNWIMFFRVTGNNGPDISRWKTAICIVHPDGTDFRQLTSGDFSDFSPVWSRDGSNFIYLNRYNRAEKKSSIYRTTVDSKPGEEILVSDPKYNEFCQTTLKDGRLLISRFDEATPSCKYIRSKAPEANGYYQPPFMLLLTPVLGKIGRYEFLNFQHKIDALANRVNLSPSESKITYEIDYSWGAGFDEHPIVIADFNVQNRLISNETVITSARPFVWDIYPSWRKDEKGIIYTSSKSGKLQFYYYDLETRTERRITKNNEVEYKYFCAEGCPK